MPDARTNLLLGATFTATAGSGVVFPLLADLQDAHDLPTAGLGLISAATFLFGVVAQLVLASQADRGRGRALLLGGLALSIVSLLGFAVADDLWELVAARAVGGLALGCFLPAARALVAVADPDSVGRNLGRLAGAELGGFVFGPIVGSAMAGAFGLDAPFLALALFSSVGLALLALRALPSAPPVLDLAPSTNPLTMLRRRPVAVAALVSVALYLPVGVFDSLWARYLSDLGGSTLFIGLSFAFYGLPFIVLASRGGRLADRVGPARAALASVVVIAPLTAVYGLIAIPGLVVSIALVEAVAQAVAVPAAQAAMAEASPPGQVAAGQGLAGALNLVAAGAAALVAPALYEATGADVVFGAAALLMAALGLAAAWLWNRSPSAVAVS